MARGKATGALEQGVISWCMKQRRQLTTPHCAGVRRERTCSLASAGPGLPSSVPAAPGGAGPKIPGVSPSTCAGRGVTSCLTTSNVGSPQLSLGRAGSEMPVGLRKRVRRSRRVAG